MATEIYAESIANIRHEISINSVFLMYLLESGAENGGRQHKLGSTIYQIHVATLLLESWEGKIGNEEPIIADNGARLLSPQLEEMLPISGMHLAFTRTLTERIGEEIALPRTPMPGIPFTRRDESEACIPFKLGRIRRVLNTIGACAQEVMHFIRKQAEYSLAGSEYLHQMAQIQSNARMQDALMNDVIERFDHLGNFTQTSEVQAILRSMNDDCVLFRKHCMLAGFDFLTLSGKLAAQ
ncbi:hypothetical protein D3C87_366400 [compost metagenome]|uniref:hypothetical protein n=1 Tax=Achromobacter sp. Root83 TaxID=1736602 RepID=UPI000ABA9BD9|nr:hypothetical protein [Achromobacter sp. Root83]